MNITKQTKLMIAGVAAATIFAPISARAQGQSQAAQPGVVSRVETINAATDIGIDQRLNNQVPLDAQFRTESGQVVALSSYFGKRPVWLVMPFYRCKGTCTQMLNGMVATMQEPNLGHKIGQDFDIVVVSIDPRETSDLADGKKKQYVSDLGISGADAGFHFLTGTEENIKKLAASIGYRYSFNPKNSQYAHPSGTFVITPQGKVARYFFGVVYPAKDVRLSVTEAKSGRIGSLRELKEAMILGCYDYDAKNGKYGLAIMRLIQGFGLATVLLLGSFIGLHVRSDIRKNRSMSKPGGAA
jgi:protein SCO1